MLMWRCGAVRCGWCRKYYKIQDTRYKIHFPRAEKIVNTLLSTGEQPPAPWSPLQPELFHPLANFLRRAWDIYSRTTVDILAMLLHTGTEEGPDFFIWCFLQAKNQGVCCQHKTMLRVYAYYQSFSFTPPPPTPFFVLVIPKMCIATYIHTYCSWQRRSGRGRFRRSS